MNKLNIHTIKAATPNQNTKKPTVAIYNIKEKPATINQICHATIKNLL